MQEVDIAFHRSVDAAAAHFYDDIAAILHRGTVYLCDGGGTYRGFVYFFKNIMVVYTASLVGFVDDCLYLGKRHRLRV